MPAIAWLPKVQSALLLRDRPTGARGEEASLLFGGGEGKHPGKVGRSATVRKVRLCFGRFSGRERR